MATETSQPATQSQPVLSKPQTKPPKSVPKTTSSGKPYLFSYESSTQKWQRTQNHSAITGTLFSSALEALESNRVRSLLTMLGMVIGVSAVIAVITLTQGVNASVNQRFASLGTTTLTISPGASSSRGALSAAGSVQTLTLADAQAIMQMHHVAYISPILNSNGQVIYEGLNWNTSIRGVYPDYQTIQNWQIAEGSWFSDAEEQSAAPVAVLGQTVVQNLFPVGTDPLNQTIRINDSLFKVVGVLQSKGSQGPANQDDTILVPFSAANERLNPSSYVNQIQVEIDDQSNIPQAQLAITALLRSRHHLPGPDPSLAQNPQNRNNLASGLGGGGNGYYRGGGGGGNGNFRGNGGAGGGNSGGSGSNAGGSTRSGGTSGHQGSGTFGRNGTQSRTAVANDFQIFSANQLISTAQQSSSELTVLLIGIAAISLTTGGIGIMNIMLVSVTERTREIGLRMAIGARQADVRNQFVMEALILSCVGGFIGIVIGILGGIALTLGMGFPFVLSPIPIVIAFSVSAIVGAIFGIYPAVRASKLDPIVALRTT
jgi:ABC-type antimicrobial peptide transport system permease subunit